MAIIFYCDQETFEYLNSLNFAVKIIGMLRAANLFQERNHLLTHHKVLKDQPQDDFIRSFRQVLYECDSFSLYGGP